MFSWQVLNAIYLRASRLINRSIQHIRGVFLHQGKNSSVIHHSCFPWSSRSFGVAELTGGELKTLNMSVEVERKFLCGPDIQKKLGDIGAVCVGKCRFQDQYFDSPDFILTLNGVWLRRREGCWELKCPVTERAQRREEEGERLCTQYQEITLLPQIIAAVREVMAGQRRDERNAQVVPKERKESDRRGQQEGEEGRPEASGEVEPKGPGNGPDDKPVDAHGDAEERAAAGLEGSGQCCAEDGGDLAWLREMNLAPFAEFTTERCSFSLAGGGEEGGVRVDLDQADFGYCVGEIEVLVPDENEVQSALQKIQRTAQRLGLTDDHKVKGKMHVYLQRYRPEHYAKLLEVHVL
ncbi:thiamine-triphosphatase isoform X1 [Conger conger]|uniref:thiamine-triphosphatase isoform X1 n=2 Tax=Conger conger TaxID=82655 RepID=UPI002A5B0AF5|nr:thiamine-triphosphatase isoform X1 [Conger conger]